MKINGDQKVIEGIVEDISQRKKTENELLTTKSYLNSIIDSMPSILIGIDTSGRITSMNKYAQDISGLSNEEGVGKKAAEIFPTYNEFFDTYICDQPTRMKHQKYSTLQDKEDQHIAISTYPLIGSSSEGTVVVIEDITEQEHKEEQLQRAQKMEVVGESWQEVLPMTSITY